MFDTYARCAGVFKAIGDSLHTMPPQVPDPKDQERLADKYLQVSATLTAKAAAISDQTSAFSKKNSYAQTYQEQIDKDQNLKALMPLAQSCNRLSRQ